MRLTSLEKAQNVVKWCRALASGKFTKTTSELRSGKPGKYRYCCLGVACEIFKLDPAFGAAGYRALPQALGLLSGLGNMKDDKNIHDCNSLVRLNDREYENNRTFTLIHKDIVDNIGVFFQPSVAKHLRKDGDAIRIVAAPKAVASSRRKRSVPAQSRG